MDRIIQNTLDNINNIIASEGEDLITGGPKDMLEYKYKVGFIAGVRAVKNSIESNFQSKDREGSISDE